MRGCEQICVFDAGIILNLDNFLAEETECVLVWTVWIL